MQPKFSEDVIPVTDLKVNPGKIIKQTTETHHPVLLTSRGRGVAIVQSLKEYEAAEEEKAFLKAISQGLMDICENRAVQVWRPDQEQASTKQTSDMQKWSLVQELAQKRLQNRLPEAPPDQFADMSESDVMQMVREEITACRQQK